jgi:wobble nucleotide-excising tRNase
MLRRLDVKAPYRSLQQGFWPAGIPLGERTVIYGHNGSGKSTVCELLLEIASGNSPVEVIWEDESGRVHKVARGGSGPAPSMAVFTRSWVEKNLSEFLVGRSASAIVTLGEEAIDAKEEEERLGREISDLAKETKDAESRTQDLKRRTERVAREVQDAIESQLREFDYRRFSRNRWSLPTVKGRLLGFKGGFPNENEHAEALKRLGEGTCEPITPIPTPPSGMESLLATLDDLLPQIPTSIALAELEARPEAQTWVERGIQHHQDLDHCLFCSGPITSARSDDLARHFDESWLDLRQRASRAAEDIRNARNALQNWHQSLPDEATLASDLRQIYKKHAELLAVEVELRLDLLERSTDIAEEKATDPSATPAVPDWKLLGIPLKVAPMVGAVSTHNEQAEAHDEITEANVEVVLDHVIGSRAESFRDLCEQLDSAVKRRTTAFEASRLAQRALDEVRQRQFSSNAMAETLTADLARVYGKHHLSVAVTEDGKSYSCRRGNAAATNLSDGERTTLSLLYFLRKLEDETETSDPARRIVVIDDPSSSLDREAVFATHQWLVDTLHGFGQFVVLTHDFNLLRLFIKSQGGRWGTSIKKIRDGDTAEAAFPGVAFLEMYASTETQVRCTKVDVLPSMLRSNVSEYAYLFSTVMNGIGDPTDVDRLFLLPNAARRVLEVFCSYTAPHEPNFDSQLRSLVEDSGDAYRDVYDFCNRYSHGEGNESVDVLDARTVHQHIRRCMEFLKDADSKHFDRMCKATKSDGSVIS